MSITASQNQSLSAGGRPATGGRERTVRVWDPLVRIFHWSLVLGIALAWLSSEGWDRTHEITGYIIAGLIGFRLLWGIVGGKYARFAQFVRGPRVTIAYLKDILSGRAKRHLGHNPAGAAMIVALLFSVATTCMTGWMMSWDAFWGAQWLEELHEGAATFILLLVGLHVAGVVHASLSHRENLVRAMFTGRKRL